MTEPISCKCCKEGQCNENPGESVVTCCECGEPCNCQGCIEDVEIQREIERMDNEGALGRLTQTDQTVDGKDI